MIPLLQHDLEENGLGKRLPLSVNVSKGRCSNLTQSPYQPSGIGIIPDLMYQALLHCYNASPE